MSMPCPAASESHMVQRLGLKVWRFGGICAHRPSKYMSRGYEEQVRIRVMEIAIWGNSDQCKQKSQHLSVAPEIV